MNADEVAAWLRARAESYGRDAAVLRSDGDVVISAAYETIRDELRKCADELTAQGVLDFAAPPAAETVTPDPTLL